MQVINIHEWSSFKALAVSKQLGFHYEETASGYLVYINEGVLVWKTIIYKDNGADVTDFETNFKAISNLPSFFLGQFRNKYRNITGNATTVVKSGTGVIRGISVNNNNTGGDIIVYDNTAGSGTRIATFQLGTPSGGLLSSTGLNGPLYINMTAEFSTGLTIVTTGSSNNNITVYYV